MITYVLILFLSIDSFSSSKALAVSNVPGFSTIQECSTAGSQAVGAGEKGVTKVHYVCVAQKKP
jgi:hypothetical protein